MTFDDREPPPTTPIAGAERWIRTKVVMKGADTWDIVVRDESSLPLHFGCGLEPDASFALLFCGTFGMEGMGSLWASQVENPMW